MPDEPGSVAFQELITDLDTPAYVVTAADGERRAGCLVGFASQTSIDPPRFTVWLSDANHTADIARHARTLVVHVLREHDAAIATRFGAESGDWADTSDDIVWSPGPDGAPVLASCDWFAGRVVEHLDGGGDHRGYVLEPFGGERRHAGLAQLGFQHVRDLRAGHPVGRRV